MTEPTEAQIKELWEWCGLEVNVDRGQFYITNRRELDYPDLDLDLNNLFKFAVPKLGELNFRLELALTAYSDANDYKIGRGFGTKMVYACSIYTADYSKMVSQGLDDNDPALALFWAIWEVIVIKKD